MIQNNLDFADYIDFNVALNWRSNVTDIEAKILNVESLWSQVPIQVINAQTITLKDT